MKQILGAWIMISFCNLPVAGEPKSSITTPVHGAVTEVTFRVESMTSGDPRSQVVRQYVVLHSVTDGDKGLAYRITLCGHPTRIEAYQFDRKTGARLPSYPGVEFILTNLHELLLSRTTLADGEEYIFSFQHYDGYYFLVDVRRKDPGAPALRPARGTPTDAAEPPLDQTKSITGRLRTFSPHARSVEAWMGHQFMVGSVPLQATDTVPEAVLLAHVGERVTVTGGVESGPDLGSRRGGNRRPGSTPARGRLPGDSR